MDGIKQLIVIITICLAFLHASIWWSWATFRRTADDVVKINQSPQKKDGTDDCIRAGGIPQYFNGEFSNCKK